MKRLNISVKISLLLGAIMLVISCAINPVTGKKQVMLMSEAQELALGSQYDPQVLATFGEYKSDALLSFIKEKTTEMGKISHRPTLEYHIKILDSQVVNAFAVPGGYIYLTRGILAQLNNEAELMGVIAHEMGHITARHSASQQTKQQLGQLVLMGTMIASERLAQYAQYAMQGMELLFLRFSRDDERMADRLGVRYSTLIGYDAHKMADFFQVLNKMSMAESVGGVPTFMSTHPDPGDRYNTVNQLATWWQDSLGMTSPKVGGDSYLQLIDGIVYGEDPRQGYAEVSIFYHPTLKFKFSFPAGWKLENTPAQINIAPADQKALMIFTMANERVLKAAADSTLKRLGLTLVESNQATVNGLPAITTVSKQIQQDQSTGATSTNMIFSYFIEYGGLIYVFHGVSADTDFSTYMSQFESSMKTFSTLTDAAKINVKPKRIIIKKVFSTGTVSSALAYYGIKQEQLAEVALLNNLELTAQVQAGKLIKVIGE
ncbi:MAG: M48 family metalloprotease [Bacteroidia bacterium]|nr:M48 family metalloprotease [Bacteroidia bacterium]